MREYATRSTVVVALGEIDAQISAHFSLEEKVIRKPGDGGFLARKQDHEQLLNELLNVIDSVHRAGRFDGAGLSRDLDW